MADPSEGGGGGSGVSGYCPDQCETSFYYYLITQIVLKTVSSTGRVGSSVLLIRSVSDEDKGLALGTLTVFISLFAFIPAPIIMGAIIDSSCLVWDKTCGRTGNCWLYDSDKFRTIIHLVPAAFILISVLGDLVVLWYSHQMDLYGDKEDELELHTTPPTTPTTPLTPLTPTSTTTTISADSTPPTPSPPEPLQHQKPFHLQPPHPHHIKKQEEKEEVEEEKEEVEEEKEEMKEEKEEAEEESRLLDHPV